MKQINCRFLLLAALLPLLSGCYLLRQGVALVGYQIRAQKNDRVLASADVEAEVRDMLLLAGEVKGYATSVLGLGEGRNYSKIVRTDDEYLVDVVSACAKDRFEPYEWRFPIVGSVPYKGFYRRKDALRLARRLERKGLDVIVRKVDAFSTLGFFSDPLYSFMADYSTFAIAELIIHEQTHAAVFLKSRVQLNEELATFVGREGALDFVRRRFGDSSRELHEAEDRIHDSRAYFELMIGLHDELDRFYTAAREAGRSTSEIIETREEKFEEFRRSFPEVRSALFRSEVFRGIPAPPLNNAYLMSFVRYGQDLDLLYELYGAVEGDLPRAVSIIRELDGVKGDPKDFLRMRIEQEGGGRGT